MCIEEAREWLRKANSVTVLTGAGISAESGVPTFRGAGGLWKQYQPEDLATEYAFARDPETVWEWYEWRRGLIQQAQPNAGHLALVDLEHRVSRFTLVTQNVDGLHQRAGSKSVLEVHGSIWKLLCTKCNRSWLDLTHPLKVPRLCECGALARPGVVWFGESLPPDIWAASESASLRCDVFLIIGTAAVVYPAAGLFRYAQSAGAKVIEINIERTEISNTVNCALIGPAGEMLPKLLATAGK